MSVALLFPGQGTQHDAMLPWLESEQAAAPVLARMAAILGSDWRTRLADSSWSQTNSVAQALVTGASVAAWAALASRLPRIVAVAGYSVGELGSSVAAGMLSSDDALALAVERAAAMDRSASGRDEGLLGLSQVEPEVIEAACVRWQLEIAIRTGERRCVLGGPADALEAAAARLQEDGAKATRLCVRVASHTSAMRAAVPELAGRLAGFAWRPPRVPWVAGVTGTVVRDVHEARRVLADQVATTIRWDVSMDTVAERKPDAVLEVGPGTTLTRLWRERHPEIAARSCDEFSCSEHVLAWLDSVGARVQSH